MMVWIRICSILIANWLLRIIKKIGFDSDTLERIEWIDICWSLFTFVNPLFNRKIIQYNHRYWNRILTSPYWEGIDHCIEKIEEKWIITTMKLEWINPIELDWKSSWIRHSINPAVYPSIICSIDNQWVTNHGFINLIIIIESNRMCLIIDSCS